ncbi:MAG: helix-turn-helix domain-containing protein [Candidatus Pacearchaeota archaeon]|nr:helix-turn-helix domain-containing protein [Candidatus Pacearchaeota archaeon]
MDLQALEDLGLTSNEAKIYFVLSRAGSLTAGEITKNVDLHRSRVYEALDRLMKKGLVKYTITNKTKYFNVKDPEALLELIAERKANIEKILPSLKEMQDHQDNKYAVETYLGIGGVKSVLKESLKAERYDVFGAPQQSIDILGEAYWKNYNLKANESKIKMRMIFNEELRSWSKVITKINIGTTIRFLEKQFDNLTETLILEDKIIILIWTIQPIGIIIREKTVSKAYKQFFELLWKQANK